jgi:hypothetical protein
VIGTCPQNPSKTQYPDKDSEILASKTQNSDKEMAKISVSKTQFFGQPFGGAFRFRGLTQCASLHFTAYQPWNEIQVPHDPLPHSLQTAADDF